MRRFFLLSLNHLMENAMQITPKFQSEPSIASDQFSMCAVPSSSRFALLRIYTILSAMTFSLALSYNAAAQEPATTAASVTQTSATAAPESDPALRLPELTASQWFDGNAAGTFGEKATNFFPRTARVAVAGFNVVFVTENFARARVRPSYMPGRDTSGASTAMQVNLKGVDDATLQLLADQAYRRFVAQLRATGREVITIDDKKWDYSGFQLSNAPMDVNFMNVKGSAFSPVGIPLWWQIGDPWSPSRFDQTNYKAMGAASNATGAPLMIAATLVIDFAQMASSGNRSGLLTRTAEVGTTLAISVNRMDVRMVRAEEVKFGGVSKGDDAWIRLTKPLETDIEFAVLTKTEKDHGGGLGGFLSKAFVGTGKTQFRLAETSNVEYSKAATAVLERATGTYAKLFTEFPVK
jgi:hypothetical protein